MGKWINLQKRNYYYIYIQYYHIRQICMYVTEPTLKQNVKMISIRNLTTYTNLTSKVMNYYLDFFQLLVFSTLEKNPSKFKKSYYTWPHSAARTNTDNGVLVWRLRIYSSMIRLLVAKKQKFPLTKKSAKLLRIEYIRDFIREPFFLSYFGLYCSTSI